MWRCLHTEFGNPRTVQEMCRKVPSTLYVDNKGNDWSESRFTRFTTKEIFLFTCWIGSWVSPKVSRNFVASRRIPAATNVVQIAGDQFATSSTLVLMKLTVAQPVKKCHSLRRTIMFTTMFTTAHQHALFWNTWIQITPKYPTSLRITTNIILHDTKLVRCLEVFQPKLGYIRISLPTLACYVSRAYRVPWFDHDNTIWCRVQIKPNTLPYSSY